MISNIPQSIKDKMNRKLHTLPDHPVCIIKQAIYDYFGDSYRKFDDLDAVVTTQANFDDLLIKSDHPCRKKSDTYYVDEKTLLRTQTSAHQTELLRKGYERFLVAGDVYRKDEVDRTHYPVFHQMEGVCLGENKDQLLATMRGLMAHLFPNCKCRVNDDYFPFTDPSFEIEVEYEGNWLEVAGCGMVQGEILRNVGSSKSGWAFGLGLERLAMILFKIPDIRMFWTTEPKFTSQFKAGSITEFKPYSKLDPITRDISFFIPGSDYKDESWLEINEFYDLCRDIAGDLLERVERFDEFFHPKQKMISQAYRLSYSPPTSFNDPAEFAKTVNEIQDTLYDAVGKKLNVILR